MKDDTYKAIKFKLKQDRMEVEEEIFKLQNRKQQVVQRRNKEEEKLKVSTQILKENRIVRASLLMQRFDSDVLKQCEREINLIDNFIQEQNIALEKIKEQEKYVDNIVNNKLKENKKKERAKEEESLFEYKKWIDFSN